MSKVKITKIGNCEFFGELIIDNSCPVGVIVTRIETFAGEKISRYWVFAD